MLLDMSRRSAPTLPTGPFRGTDAVASGLLTAGQLRGPGWRPLLRNAYVAAGIPVTHRVRCEATALVAPPAAVLTGRSAAEVRGIELADRADPVEIVVDEADRFGPVRGLRIKRTILSPGDSRPWRGIRLASPARMGFDLGRQGDLADAVADLDAAVRGRLLTVAELEAYLDGRTEHGTGQVREVARLLDPRAASRPESKLRVLLRLAGLDPEVQHPILDANGFVARVDLAFPGCRVAVEYDGEWHALRMQLSKDRQRMNRIQAAGWQVVFVTSDMLRGDHREILAVVRAALARASW